MQEQRRRAEDKLMLEMHGDIKMLLANHENIKSHLSSVSKKTDEHQKCITKMKSDITGIKAIGSIGGTIFAAVIGLFWRR